MTRLRRFTTAAGAVALSLIAGEVAVRSIDGYALTSLHLTLSPEAARDQALGADRQYLGRIDLAAGVDRAWYDSDPPAPARFPDNPALADRVREYPSDPIGALLVWNQAYLRRELCAGNQVGSLGILKAFYAFTPAVPGPFPIFRHQPNASPPGWFTSNRFGWRGPDLTLDKPPRTVRIAFVGASTTVSAYYLPFSHPEFIGHWLNLWAIAKGLSIRFEIINAGRTGIDSYSIAAIVEQEVAPVDPDLVIYYEGANQFAVGRTLGAAADASIVSAVQPTVTFRQRWAAERYLATAVRILAAIDQRTNPTGSEPPKPGHPTVWPERVDEQQPDVTAPLPIDLDLVVSNLDAMRRALAVNGAELAMSSFIWLVYDGMRLDPERDMTIYRQLNEMYWPASYRHLRRMADFQNRVFEQYAGHYGLPYFDIAERFPLDARLFGDAIHLRPEGLRLQAWIYMQQLVPVIEDRLESGRWPRDGAARRVADPSAFTPTLISRDSLLATCSS